MDTYTLLICTAIVSFFMFFTTFLLYKTSVAQDYLLDWSFSGLAFLASSVVGILGSYYESLPVYFPALANTFYILGHAAILTGTIKLTAGNSHWRDLTLVSLLVASIHLIEFTQSSIENRILTFYPIILIACFGTIFVAWNERKSSINKALWLLLIVESLFVAQLIIRACIMLFDGESLQIFGRDFMRTSGSLALLIFLFLITLCAVFTVSWKKEIRLKELSLTDYLTGWFNRRALVETGSSIFERCKREDHKLGVIIFDIDLFKQVNDNHGHLVGDEAIKHVCNIAIESKRSYDFHFRLGGEEFAILLENTDLLDIKTISERIRFSIEHTPLNWNGDTIPLTVSVGLSLSTQEDKCWEQVLERADNALYEAKSTGRNIVKVSKDCNVTATIPVLITP